MTRILLVDDEPLILEVLGTTLADEGYTVETAPNGRDALALIEANPPDLVLSDVMMPHLTGWELLAHVRERFPTLPVILLSAVIRWDRQPDLGTTNHTVFLRKPFDIEQLLTIVVRLVGSSGR